MNFSNIVKSVSSFAGKAITKIQIHSPEILVGAGVVGVVVGAVFACKATLKAEDILEETKEDLEKINDCAADEGLKESGKYTEEDERKDKVHVYTKTALRLAKVYAPAVAIGVLSITSIFVSNGILKKRNLSLAAAYSAVDAGYKAYRSRVVDKYGQEADNELLYNPEKEKIEEIEIDEETGKEKKVKKTIEVLSPELDSPYAVYFDERSRAYEDDITFDEMFLNAQESRACDLLRARLDHTLFLNDVLDLLDLPKVQMGQMVGWKYSPDNHTGDNMVNFRKRLVYRRTKDGGHKRYWLLDFNVDGCVLDNLVKVTA